MHLPVPIDNSLSFQFSNTFRPFQRIRTERSFRKEILKKQKNTQSRINLSIFYYSPFPPSTYIKMKKVIKNLRKGTGEQ